MLLYVARRLVQSIVIMLLLTLLTFALLHAIPGGQARGILGPRASASALTAFEHENGLDRPIFVQYLVYLGHLLHGNLGYSYKLNQTVGSLFGQDLPKSLALVGPPLVASIVLAVPIGLYQSQRRNKPDDALITAGGYVLYSMPDFWLAFILIDFFAIRHFWLPPVAPSGASWTIAFTDSKAMVLPWVTLLLVLIAGYSRYMRSAALDVYALDHIRLARAKGASRLRVLRLHVTRNALTPIITLVGLSIPSLLGGALIEEVVFNYPGIGLATFNAAVVKDYPVVLGTTIVFGFLTILGNLVADVLYAYVDPRVRLA